ncbi:MAG: hypothetical protein K0S11_1483 [Gammaproteobacteria bacterium]|jgi:hypothetical protein|nr:hypothetical protein [Gammaproteobacteria bacterium]
MSKSNRYNAILKPIFIKEKSIANSIKSPFVAILSQGNLAKLNQASKGFDIKLAPTKLTYPLGHLKKLLDLKYIELIEINGRWLIVQDNSKQIFQVKLPEPISIDFKDKQSMKNFIFKDPYYTEPNHGSYYNRNKKKVVEIYNEGKSEVIKVLGVKSSETNGEFYPIICDVDAHNFSTQHQSDSIKYDTSKENEFNQLKEAVKNLLTNKLPDKEVEGYINSINAHLGTITVQEYIIYHAINIACGRPLGLNAIFQHGATANMSDEQVKNARLSALNNIKHEVVEEKDVPFFPAITNDKKIVAIFDKGLFVISGAHIILFYNTLNKSYKYNFNMLPLWQNQLRELEQNSNYEKFIQDIKENLHQIAESFSDVSLNNASVNNRDKDSNTAKLIGDSSLEASTNQKDVTATTYSLGL